MFADSAHCKLAGAPYDCEAVLNVVVSKTVKLGPIRWESSYLKSINL